MRPHASALPAHVYPLTPAPHLHHSHLCCALGVLPAAQLHLRVWVRVTQGPPHSAAAQLQWQSMD
jgi:hypothetical protein